MTSIWYHLAGRLGNQLFQLAQAHQLVDFYDRPVKFFTDRIHGDLNYDFNAVEKLPSLKVSGVFQSMWRGRVLQYSDRLHSKDLDKFQSFNRHLNILRSMQAFEIPNLPSRAPSLVTGFCINSRVLQGSGIFVSLLEEYLDFIATGRFWEKFNDYQVIHIRGTDLKNSVYGSLSSNFYNAFELADMPIFVLTDDLAHAKVLTQKLDVHKFLSPYEINPWEAISIMRNSKRLFASNSTLAWWGAYMSLKNKNEVFLPQPFYKGNSSLQDYLHLDGFNYLKSNFD